MQFQPSPQRQPADLTKSFFPPRLQELARAPAQRLKPGISVVSVERVALELRVDGLDSLVKGEPIRLPKGFGYRGGSVAASIVTLSNGHTWVLFDAPVRSRDGRSGWVSTRFHPRGGRQDEVLFGPGPSSGRWSSPCSGVRWQEPSGVCHEVVLCGEWVDASAQSMLMSAAGFASEGRSQRFADVWRWRTLIPTSLLSPGATLTYRCAFQPVYRMGLGRAISDGEITLPVKRPQGREWSENTAYRSISWAKIVPTARWTDFLEQLQGNFAEELFPDGTITEQSVRAVLKQCRK